ncbi:MAG: stage III sporulation protein AD [Firmicutes bacterium]|nr:stage III sporulation protein AD [Bacillota bacterium]
MSDIARIVGLGIIITVLLAHLRKRYPELAPELSLAFVVGVFLILMGPLGRVLQVFSELGQRADLSGFYLGVILRSIGIAYLTALGAQVSKDAGEEAVALVIEIAGKIMILMISIPVVVAILDSLVGLLP